MRKCTCDSGKWGEEVYDARGIYVTIVCDHCRDDKLGGYRVDIFTDPNYECDEDIGEDYYED